MPTIVATSIPLNTVVPMIRRLCAPAPVASIIGMMPIINDTAVIITARKRRVAPSRAASTIDSPSSRRLRANSTIRIAFFAAGGDQQHQPYLNIHIVGIARGPQPEQRSADGEQHREHDARRQRPALILRHRGTATPSPPPPARSTPPDYRSAAPAGDPAPRHSHIPAVDGPAKSAPWPPSPCGC